MKCTYPGITTKNQTAQLYELQVGSTGFVTGHAFPTHPATNHPLLPQEQAHSLLFILLPPPLLPLTGPCPADHIVFRGVVPENPLYR